MSTNGVGGVAHSVASRVERARDPLGLIAVRRARACGCGVAARVVAAWSRQVRASMMTRLRSVVTMSAAFPLLPVL
jgi:hypothetical protein